MTQNIQHFFNDRIQLPDWIQNAPFNAPLVMAYCVNQFIGQELQQKDIGTFYDANYGTTANKMMAYFERLGLKVEVQTSLNHQQTNERLKTGTFTFLSYHNNPPNISFVRYYDAYLDKFLLFDFKFELIKLTELELSHAFTVETKDYLKRKKRWQFF